MKELRWSANIYKTKNTYVDWGLEIPDVEDVGDRVEIECRVVGVKVFFLVILVIKNQEFLPFGVKHRSLMSIGGSNVWSSGNNYWSLLVGHIIAGGSN